MLLLIIAHYIIKNVGIHVFQRGSPSTRIGIDNKRKKKRT